MPRRMRDLSDTDLGTLNSTKNKYVMRYSASSGKFDIVNVDTIISAASTSIPDQFVTQVEAEVDTNNISFSGLDGGTF